MSSPPTRKRTTIYLSEAEKTALEKRAVDAGFSLSRFIVLAGLNYVLPFKVINSTVNDPKGAAINND